MNSFNETESFMSIFYRKTNLTQLYSLSTEKDHIYCCQHTHTQMERWHLFSLCKKNKKKLHCINIGYVEKIEANSIDIHDNSSCVCRYTLCPIHRVHNKNKTMEKKLSSQTKWLTKIVQNKTQGNRKNKLVFSFWKYGQRDQYNRNVHMSDPTRMKRKKQKTHHQYANSHF